MQRREFVYSGASLGVFAVLSGTLSRANPAVAGAIQGARVIGSYLARNPKVAEAALRCFGEFCGAAAQFRGQQRDKTNAEFLASKYSELKTTLDSVYALIKALPDVRQLLIEDRLSSIYDSIDTIQSSILEQIQSGVKGGFTSTILSSLGSLALSQQIARNSLNPKKYGPGVYPYIARAFASQALALNAIGGEAAMFETCKQNTLKALYGIGRQFSGFQKATEKRHRATLETWDAYPKRVYVGRHCNGVKYCTNYYMIIRGDVESGVRDAGGPEESGMWIEPNNLGWRRSKHIVYSDDYSIEKIQRKRSYLLEQMNDLGNVVRAAEAEAASYGLCAATCEGFHSKIAGMLYMTDGQIPA